MGSVLGVRLAARPFRLLISVARFGSEEERHVLSIERDQGVALTPREYESHEICICPKCGEKGDRYIPI